MYSVSLFACCIRCKTLTSYLVSISAREFSLKQILVPQLGLIGTPVHLVSLCDKYWRPILDMTPLNTRLRASKFVLHATINNCIVVLYHATKIFQLL